MNNRRQSTIDSPIDGTIHVSEPFLTPRSKKLRALIAFTPRVSHFDSGNTHSVSNEFRGFFTLFWISIFIVTLQSYVRTYETSGHPIALAFAAMFSQHALPLALSDALLVFSTTFSVLFAIALKRNTINYYQSGIIIQHTFQAIVLLSAVTWTFNRQWPWVQSGFLTLHAIVCLPFPFYFSNLY
jgi:sterol O-acyltransferase